MSDIDSQKEQTVAGKDTKIEEDTASEKQDKEKPSDVNERYERASFVRREEELEFYKTPDIKKNHLLVILFSAVFLIFLCVFAVFSLISTVDRLQPIKIRNNSSAEIGIYDPSIAYDAVNDRFWLAYSSIIPKENKNNFDININIAYLTSVGGQWNYGYTVFKGKKDLLDTPDGRISEIEGIWRYETPTLVYNPDDTGKEWKIFAYKYFWTGNKDDARKYSAIVLKTTSDISSPYKWSNEKWLFSARLGQPPAPYEHLVLLHLNRLDPALSNVAYYAEPAAIYYKGILLMAFTVYRNDSNKPDSIVMIGSQDNGNSWFYLGEILNSNIAKHYGRYDRVDASSFTIYDGKLYLMVSFGSSKVKHMGTHIFEFENFAKAKLKSDKKSIPILVNYIAPPFPNSLTEIGGGSAAYHEKLGNNVFISQKVGAGIENSFSIYAVEGGLLKK